MSTCVHRQKSCFVHPSASTLAATPCLPALCWCPHRLPCACSFKENPSLSALRSLPKEPITPLPFFSSPSPFFSSPSSFLPGTECTCGASSPGANTNEAESDQRPDGAFNPPPSPPRGVKYHLSHSTVHGISGSRMASPPPPPHTWQG